MPKTRRTSIALGLAAALALAAPAASHAKTFCVNAGAACPEAGVDAGGQLQGAIAGAEASPGADVVLVGDTGTPYSGVFSANGVVAAPERIDIVGVGGRPVVTGPAGSTPLTLRKASARGIAIKLPIPEPTAPTGVVLRDGASVDGVTIRSSFGALFQTGIRVDGVATVANTAIDFTGAGSTDEAVFVSATGSLTADRLTVTNGGRAFVVRDGSAVVTRSRLGGLAFGVAQARGQLRLERTIVHGPDGPGNAGISSTDGRLALDHVTVAAREPGVQGQVHAGLALIASNGTSDVTLESVVLAGFEQSIRRTVNNNGVSILSASRSVWDNRKDTPRPVTEVGNVHAEPALADLAGGDFRPRPGSPAVDLDDGSAASLYADLDGTPALDGDGDGIVQPDAGALELSPPGPAEPAPPAPAPPVPPAPPAPPAGPAPDRVAPSLSALKVKPGGKLRAKRVRRLTLELALSEAAAVRVTATRGRRSAVVSRSLRPGRARIALLGDLRRRNILGRGKIAVKVVATDAAGNRSRTAVVRVRLR